MRCSSITVIMLGIFLFLFCLLFVPFHEALSFYKQHTNHLEAYLSIRKGDCFHITFTHSIHLTDVVEKYEVTEDKQIKQYEIVFEQFGIGMPANTEEAGEIFLYENGKYYIKNMNRLFPSIHLRNGKTVSNHRLIWGDRGEKIVSFNEYFDPGARLTLKIEKLSLWQRLKGEKIDE
ncbi:MAG TPA: DUF1850 domain-containing protein [Bacillota bacterium]